MESDSIDPRWPRLLALAVHELRTPITVVSGYIRMLLKERAGPISDTQRKLLEEAEKSCGRLSALVSEMSDLSGLEAGTAGLNPGTVELRQLMADAAAALPSLPDREVQLDLEPTGPPLPVQGDATRLKNAITSLFLALRREVVNSERLAVRTAPSSGPGPRSVTIWIADGDQIDTVQRSPADQLETFDEWRGGSGLSLAIARRIIMQHGGNLRGGPGGLKTAAVVQIPSA